MGSRKETRNEGGTGTGWRNRKDEKGKNLSTLVRVLIPHKRKLMK